MSARIELAIGERVLDSGLTLLAVQNEGVATFAAAVVLDVDLRDEAKSEAGLANLVGDTLDEGTKKRSNLQLAEAIEDIGGGLEGSMSGGSVQVPAKSSVRALELLAEIVLQPSFPRREVQRVKEEILTEILAEEDDPRSVAALRFRKEVYGPHPYARPPHGTRKSVASFSPADCRRFHRKWFTPHRGYVAASGPEPVAVTLDLLQKQFARFRGKPPRHPETPAPPWPEARTEVHVPMPREQVHVYLGHPGIRRTDPDYYALLVMDHILGSGPGFTSRISRRLRDEMGLCYSVHASITNSAGEEPGWFGAYIGTSPEHRQAALDGFLDEIRRIRDTLPTEDELRDVKEYLTGSFVFGLERNANLVRYAVRAKRFDLGFDYLHRYPELIRAVTPEDVQRVARTHLDPERIVIVSAGAS